MTPTQISQCADAFVAAVWSNDEKETRARGEVLVAGLTEGQDDHEQLVEHHSGYLITDDQLPSDPDEPPDEECGVELLESAVSADRLQAILEGATLSASELLEWKKRAVARMFELTLDADGYASWFIHEVHHRDGRTAFLARLVSGYSWSGISGDYAGAGRTVEEVSAHVRALGVMNSADYLERMG